MSTAFASPISFGVRLRMNTGCLRQLVLIACPGWIADTSTSIEASASTSARRVHLVDERKDDGRGTHAGEADGGDIDEVTTADRFRMRGGGAAGILRLIDRRHS